MPAFHPGQMLLNGRHVRRHPGVPMPASRIRPAKDGTFGPRTCAICEQINMDIWTTYIPGLYIYKINTLLDSTKKRSPHQVRPNPVSANTSPWSHRRPTATLYRRATGASAQWPWNALPRADSFHPGYNGAAGKGEET